MFQRIVFHMVLLAVAHNILVKNGWSAAIIAPTLKRFGTVRAIAWMVD